MPSFGGAENLRRGDRVRVSLHDSYRHYLNGLEGVVTAVLHHGVIVALDNDPVRQQKVIAPAGKVGPVVPNQAQRQFQFNEITKLS